MRRLFGASLAALLVSWSGSALATCPTTLSDCQSGNLKNLSVGGAISYGGAFPVGGLKADATSSDDVALSAAVEACAAKGGAIRLPPGRIKLTGAATISLRNCSLEGAGVPLSGSGWGTTILLTSTTVKPFIIGSNVRIKGVNFFWPGQTGAVAYPPLFSDAAGGARQEQVYIDNVTIANAYDGFVQIAGSTWANWFISNSSMYAVHELFNVASTPDAWRLSDVHFTHGAWASTVGYPTVAAYLNAANASNTIWHVPTDSVVTIAMSNVTAFSWRYGFKVDGGADPATRGRFINSMINVDWDGVATWLDMSNGIGGCADATTFNGSGGTSFRPVFATDGSVTGTGTAPVFKFGAGASDCHGPTIGPMALSSPVQGSFLESAGTGFVVNHVQTPYGNANDGTDYYGVLVSANVAGTSVQIRNSTFGGKATAKHHGITIGAALNGTDITGNLISTGNEGISLVLGSNTAKVTNNTILSTFGTSSFVTSGTGTLLWSGNILDKPGAATPTLSNCGTGATITGVLSGEINVGSTNPTSSCEMTLAWAPYRGASCRFQGRAAAALDVFRTTVGGLAMFTIATVGAVDMHNLQIWYSCSGNE